jgi:predicted nucleotidyltransferase
MAVTKRKKVKEAKTPYRARRKLATKPAEPAPLRWADIDAATEPILLKRAGEPVAVVIPYADYLRLENARKEQATVPMAEIQKIVDLIAEKFNPNQIILFGSYAYGLPRRGSDVDLLVVLETEKDVMDAALEMRLALPMRSFGLDLIVRTPAEIERRLKMEDRFITEIAKLGKVLYERKNG